MIIGAALPRHQPRAQPYEGSCEKSSSSLHGYFSTANRVPVHGRGALLPPPCTIQNVASRSIRRNEGPSRPPQHLQESNGITRIPRPGAMSGLRYHAKRPSIGLVQQTPAIINLILQRALHLVYLPLHRSSDKQEVELSLANHQAATPREPEVICPKVQRKVFEGGRPRREVRHHRFHHRTKRTIKGLDGFHLKESIGDHG